MALVGHGRQRAHALVTVNKHSWFPTVPFQLCAEQCFAE